MNKIVGKLTNRDNSVNPVNKRIDLIWKAMLDLKDSYVELESTEKEISKVFRDIYESLIREEHNIKQSLVAEKHKVTDNIDKLVNELKQINIIVNNIHGLPDEAAANDKRLSMSSVTSCLEYEEEEIDNINDNKLVNSIKESKDIDEFLNRNRDSIFYNVCSTPTNSSHDFQILESIQKYFHHFGLNGKDAYESLQCKTKYDVVVVKDFIEQLSTNINKSIYLVPTAKDSNSLKANISKIDRDLEQIQQQLLPHSQPPSLPQSRPQSNTYSSFYTPSTSRSSLQSNSQSSLHSIIHPQVNIVRPNSSYIFTCDEKKVVTLVDITNKNNIQTEKLCFPFNSQCLPNSMVNVGEYIYMFGSYNESVYINDYYRFSINTKSIDFQSPINNLSNQADFLSTCHDGMDHIYIVNNPLEVLKFNMKTQRFQTLYHDPQSSHSIISCFYYKHSLYLISNTKRMIYKMSPLSKQLCEHIKLESSIKVGSCCIDDCGNIYLTYIGTNIIRFIKINLESKEITKCASLKFVFKNYLTMLFCRAGENESNIYLIGGNEHGNHIYSVEKDSWNKLDWKDDNGRCYCGSTIIKT